MGVKTTPGLSSSLVVQALHKNAIDAMKVRGGNALGVEADGPLMSMFPRYCTLHSNALSGK